MNRECYGKMEEGHNSGGRKTCWQSLLEKLNLRGLVRIMLWGRKLEGFLVEGRMYRGMEA